LFYKSKDLITMLNNYWLKIKNLNEQNKAWFWSCISGATILLIAIVTLTLIFVKGYKPQENARQISRINKQNNNTIIKDYMPQENAQQISIINKQNNTINNRIIDHIQKRAKQKDEIIYPKIKITLKRCENATTEFITEYIKKSLEIFFQHNGFFINNDTFDGEITGTISVSDIREILLSPYGSPSETKIQRKISIDDLTITSNQGILPIIHHFSYVLETFKHHDYILIENLSPLITELNNYIKIKTIEEFFGIKVNDNLTNSVNKELHEKLNYLKVQERLKQFTSLDNPMIQEIKKNVEQAINNGDFDKANKLIDEIEKHYLDFFADQKVKNMFKANIAFDAPKTMELENTVFINLILSFKKTETELIDDLVVKKRNEGGEIIETKQGKFIADISNSEVTFKSSRINVSSKMKAELLGKNFKVLSITAMEQVITHKDETEWKWEITPLKTGIQFLHLKLTAIFSTDTNQAERSLEPYSRRIDVKITSSYKRMSLFISNNWQWVGSTLTTIFVAWYTVYLTKKRNKNKPKRKKNKIKKKK